MCIRDSPPPSSAKGTSTTQATFGHVRVVSSRCPALPLWERGWGATAPLDPPARAGGVFFAWCRGGGGPPGEQRG
eukprot:6540931-Alexandrium_andersonii.AAC.1